MFSNLILCALALTLVVTALVYMVSPRAAGTVFKRFGVPFLGVLIGVPVLWSFIVSSAGAALFLILVAAASVAAYFIRGFLLRGGRENERQLWGVERTPHLPHWFDEDHR